MRRGDSDGATDGRQDEEEDDDLHTPLGTAQPAAAPPYIRTSGAGRTSGGAPAPTPISPVGRRALSPPSLCERRGAGQEPRRARFSSAGSSARRSPPEAPQAGPAPPPPRARSSSFLTAPPSGRGACGTSGGGGGAGAQGPLFNFFLITELDLAPRQSVRRDRLQNPAGASRVAREAGPSKALSLQEFPCAVSPPEGSALGPRGEVGYADTHRHGHTHAPRPGGAPLSPWSHPIRSQTWSHISPHLLRGLPSASPQQKCHDLYGITCKNFCSRLKYFE